MAAPEPPLRLAVVGAGIMGANHARVAAALPGVELAALVDPDRDRTTGLVATFGGRPAEDVEEVLDAVDAVVVAAPSDRHRELAEVVAGAGKHLLVEKPLATSVADAEAVVAAAGRAGVVLAVGHVERFNPAVLELDTVLGDRDRIVHVSTSRLGPYSPRPATGVVLDLLVHDLDLVRDLVGREVAEVHAVGRAVRSGSEDLVSALLRFEGGVTADLTASRVAQQKVRTVGITLDDCHVGVDLLRQEIQINRVDHAEYVGEEGARYRQSGTVEIPFLEHRGEPLALELADFVAAIRDGRPPRVPGADGVAALALARRVLDAGG